MDVSVANRLPTGRTDVHPDVESVRREFRREARLCSPCENPEVQVLALRQLRQPLHMSSGHDETVSRGDGERVREAAGSFGDGVELSVVEALAEDAGIGADALTVSAAARVA